MKQQELTGVEKTKIATKALFRLKRPLVAISAEAIRRGDFSKKHLDRILKNGNDKQAYGALIAVTKSNEIEKHYRENAIQDFGLSEQLVERYAKAVRKRMTVQYFSYPLITSVLWEGHIFPLFYLSRKFGLGAGAVLATIYFFASFFASVILMCRRYRSSFQKSLEETKELNQICVSDQSKIMLGKLIKELKKEIKLGGADEK